MASGPYVDSDKELRDENIDSIVDEFFSFIDEDLQSGWDYNDDFGLDSNPGIPPSTRRCSTDEYHTVPSHLEVNSLLDEHFSFLEDEVGFTDDSDQFYSLEYSASGKPSRARCPKVMSRRGGVGDNIYENMSSDMRGGSFSGERRSSTSVNNLLEESIYENVSPRSEFEPIQYESGFGDRKSSVYLNPEDEVVEESPQVTPATTSPEKGGYDVTVTTPKAGSRASTRILLDSFGGTPPLLPEVSPRSTEEPSHTSPEVVTSAREGMSKRTHQEDSDSEVSSRGELESTTGCKASIHRASGDPQSTWAFPPPPPKRIKEDARSPISGGETEGLPANPAHDSCEAFPTATGRGRPLLRKEGAVEDGYPTPEGAETASLNGVGCSLSPTGEDQTSNQDQTSRDLGSFPADSGAILSGLEVLNFSPDSEKRLEILHSLDREIEQLESLHPGSSSSSGDLKSLSSFSDQVAEAINSGILSDNASLFTLPSNLTLNTEAPSIDGEDKCSESTLSLKKDKDRANSSALSKEDADRASSSRALLPNDRSSSSMALIGPSPSLGLKERFEPRSGLEDNPASLEVTFPSGPIQRDGTPMVCGSGSNAEPSSSSFLDGSSPLSRLEEEPRSVASSISGVIRRSMRRMKHIRLSGKRPKKGKTSEETEVRRQFPAAPEVGLPSVRSPTSSAVLLPSILAAFTPNDPPREFLPLREGYIASSMDQNRSLSEERDTPAHQPHDEPSRSTQSAAPRSCRPSVTEVNTGSSTPENLPPQEEAFASGLNILPQRISSESSSAPDNVTPNGHPSSRLTEVPQNASNGNYSIITNNYTRSRLREHRRETPNNDNYVRTPSGSDATSNRLSGEQSPPSSVGNGSAVPRGAPAPARENTWGFLPPMRSLWPHKYSGLMVSLAVTLNLFNISRFAVLGAVFGWSFPVQWLILSFVIGLPLMTFHSAIGQTIGGSVIDMWAISPIFQGVGVGLLLAEAAIGIYCCVPIAWLFTYFRDSFHRNPFCRRLSLADCDIRNNLTRGINAHLPNYFSLDVLQMPANSSSVISTLGSIKFDLAFNIVLIWIITSLALSRGVRSYGKICYIVILLPLASYLTVAFYLVCRARHQLTIEHFEKTFTDRNSWMVASREAFLVWGLHGAVLQQAASSNKRRHALWKDTTIIAIFTILGLGLASVCGLVFTSVLKARQLVYVPSSFETNDSRAFVRMQTPVYSQPNEFHENWFYFYDNFYVGIRVRQWSYISGHYTASGAERSGYHCIRFLTEMFPAMLYADRQLHGLWPPPVFYLGLLLFGLAHLWAVWHTVVQGLIRVNHRLLAPWETTVTFCTCLFALSCSLLMTTGLGIQVIYFFDYVIGCVWWIMILQLILVFAILFVRGKPYKAQVIARHLFGSEKCCSFAWITAPITFSWTIMVPVGLLVLSISSFKTGNYREVFAWESKYWSAWTCQLASGLQLLPLLTVPLVGLIQTCRYLADPRGDLFERIQYLYRPFPFTGLETDYSDTYLAETRDAEDSEAALQTVFTGNDSTSTSRDLSTVQRPFSDPPPKYTPPPSYSTATGSGLHKFFNRTLRHSMRRLRESLLMGPVSPRANARDTSTDSGSEPYIPPPDYLHSISARGPSADSSSEPYVSAPEYLHPVPTLGPSEAPPCYATLDPLRIRGSRHPPRTKIPREVRVPSSGELSTTPGPMAALSALSASSLRAPMLPLALSRSFSRSSSARRSSRLRRTLSSTLRRSSRRFALNISSEDGSWDRRPQGRLQSSNRGLESAEWAPARSLSGLVLTTQSEA